MGNRIQIVVLLMLCLLLACKKDKVKINMKVITSPVTDQLRSIYFADKLMGFIVGGRRYDRGVLLKTLDGGNSWTASEISDKILFNIQFLDSLGFAVGLDGRILKSNDFANTWTLYQTPQYLDLHGVQFTSPLDWLGVGGSGYFNGTLLRTNNQGLLWVRDSVAQELRSIEFTSPSTGYIAGYGLVLKTIDGGASWQATSAAGDYFVDIDFPTEDVGYIVGFNGSILRTVNAGKDWQKQRNGNSLANKQLYFEAVAFLSELEGYIVGRKGVFLKTVDGGNNWLTMESGTKEDFYDIWPLNSQSGIIVGDNGVIFRYTN